MISMDRKSAVVAAVASVAGLTAMGFTIHYGIKAKYPIAGIVVGLFGTGPAAGAIAGNVMRAVLGPSSDAPRIEGSPPTPARASWLPSIR